MHDELIQRLVEEIRTDLAGRFLGKIFQLSPVSFAFDFGLRGSFLFVSADPASPRFYLIHRRAKELDKQGLQLAHFGQTLRSKAGGSQLISVDKEPLDRVVRLTLRNEDDLGATHFLRLVIQLTGRSANLFLLDELNRIVAVLRMPNRKTGVPLRTETGQQPGEIYRPPPAPETTQRATLVLSPGSPSAQADAYFAAADEAEAFDYRANRLRSGLRVSIRRLGRLKAHLQKDLIDHGDPREHKKTGDLLLANVATAQREGNKVRITDYYADGAPLIEVEIDENRSLQDEAARRFRQYSKAKKAGEQIAARLAHLDRETAQLETRAKELESIIEQRNAAALDGFDTTRTRAKASRKRSAASQNITGVRRYRSTDGYEILVGRAARDNDKLTFRLAQPNDLWLHAGDYPGSHVVVRNPTRKEIPQRTVIEAAQLAGRFSQASEDAKVVVHYTERKFLSKPKGAAPGLVRLSRFRSITIEPKEAVERIKTL